MLKEPQLVGPLRVSARMLKLPTLSDLIIEYSDRHAAETPRTGRGRVIHESRYLPISSRGMSEVPDTIALLGT